MRKLIAVTLMLAVVGLLTANTLPGASPTLASEEKEIKIVMGKPEEFRFEPAEIALKNGETVKLYLKNEGKIKHEIMSDLFYWAKDVEIEIEGVGEIEVPTIYEIELEPGKEVEVEFKVEVDEHILEEKEGKVEFEFGCFIKGHYKAGMKGTIVVEGEHK